LGQYGEGLVWAGFTAVGLGMLSFRGQIESTRSFGYQYSLSVEEKESWQRTREMVAEVVGVHRLLILMLVVGCMSISVGWLLQRIS
jgi:hypothetical protein